MVAECFRAQATGITNFLENDGTLEAAQRIAGHADSRTTKLYDRRGQKVLLEDMEIGEDSVLAINALKRPPGYGNVHPLKAADGGLTNGDDYHIRTFQRS